MPMGINLNEQVGILPDLILQAQKALYQEFSEQFASNHLVAPFAALNPYKLVVFNTIWRSLNESLSSSDGLSRLDEQVNDFMQQLEQHVTSALDEMDPQKQMLPAGQITPEDWATLKQLVFIFHALEREKCVLLSIKTQSLFQVMDQCQTVLMGLPLWIRQVHSDAMSQLARMAILCNRLDNCLGEKGYGRVQNSLKADWDKLLLSARFVMRDVKIADHLNEGLLALPSCVQLYDAVSTKSKSDRAIFWGQYRDAVTALLTNIEASLVQYKVESDALADQLRQIEVQMAAIPPMEDQLTQGWHLAILSKPVTKQSQEAGVGVYLFSLLAGMGERMGVVALQQSALDLALARLSEQTQLVEAALREKMQLIHDSFCALNTEVDALKSRVTTLTQAVEQTRTIWLAGLASLQRAQVDLENDLENNVTLREHARVFCEMHWWKVLAGTVIVQGVTIPLAILVVIDPSKMALLLAGGTLIGASVGAGTGMTMSFFKPEEVSKRLFAKLQENAAHSSQSVVRVV